MPVACCMDATQQYLSVLDCCQFSSVSMSNSTQDLKVTQNVFHSGVFGKSVRALLLQERTVTAQRVSQECVVCKCMQSYQQK